MSWKEAEKMMRSDFVSLPNDQDTVTGVFVGEPFCRSEKGSNGQQITRAYFSIVTSIGLQAWGVTRRTFKLLDNDRTLFDGKTVKIVRSGVRNASDTTYAVSHVSNVPALSNAAKAVTPLQIKLLQQRILSSADSSPQVHEE